MSLPKSLSDSLVKKLNAACSTFSGICDQTCDNIGWCETCWIAADSENGKDGDTDGKAKR